MNKLPTGTDNSVLLDETAPILSVPENALQFAIARQSSPLPNFVWGQARFHLAPREALNQSLPFAPFAPLLRGEGPGG